MKHAIYAAAVLFSAFAFAAPPAEADGYGRAPWCAVIDMGTGDVHWDCEYATVEQCVPNVLAGNRGFCDLNPFVPDEPVPASRHKRHVKHG